LRILTKNDRYHIGGQSLSPFGLITIFPSIKRYYLSKIQEYFPRLQEEACGHGMAAFLKEVAIDINFIVESHPCQDSTTVEPDVESGIVTTPQHPGGSVNHE
jgi:hypothetical protein